MVRLLVTLVGGLLALSPAAFCQTTKPQNGEIVMKASGELAGDWKEVSVCKDRNPCIKAIINTKTHEGARLGDRWSTRFGPTGNGKEVVRALEGPSRPPRQSGQPAKMP